MPEPLGSITKTLFLKSESHKLFEEFTVATAATVVKGQPVVLSTVGTISGATHANTTQQIIGVALHDGIAGELVTVMMKAHLISFGEVGPVAGINAGPIALESPGLNTDGDRVLVTDQSVTHLNQIGWALDDGDQGDEVRIAWL